jgi:hypothetical protein
MKVTGRVQMIIMRPIREMLVCVENLEPENNNICVTTAPTVPPLPVIPAITPSDLQQYIFDGSPFKHDANVPFFYIYIYNKQKSTLHALNLINYFGY